MNPEPDLAVAGVIFRRTPRGDLVLVIYVPFEERRLSEAERDRLRAWLAASFPLELPS